VASRTLDDLLANSRSVRNDLARHSRGTGDAELDAELWKQTLEEKEKGWLEGPVSPADLDAEFPLGWLPARRFGVRQGEKTRAIDDYSAHGQNDGLSSEETVAPSDLDAIAAGVRLHLAALLDPDLAACTDDAKPPRRHQNYDGTALQGRLWDLAHAYRQLARCPSHACVSIVAVWNPSLGRHDFFRQTALPFGASASVLAFNWMATALCLCLIRLFKICSSHFYDDYTVLEVAPLTASATETVEGYFDLLGWELKPLDPFSATPAPLGAILDLTCARDGVCTIKNKEKRVEEIRATIEDLLRDDCGVDAAALQSIRGRLIHARAQSFGKFGGLALRAVAEAIRAKSRGARLSAECEEGLLTFITYLSAAPPREIRLEHSSPPLLFTDGACEEIEGRTTASIGGIIFDPP